jgi:GR25 family glycosyltransferase involved in LPS biosynthesis
MDQQLSARKLPYLRISAVNGAEIPFDPHRSHLGTGELGCLLSHAYAWRLITRAQDEHGLVLEDDILVCPDFGDLIRSMSLDPKEFCIHKLETLFDPARRTIKNLTIYQWVPALCIQDFLLEESENRRSLASNIGIDRSDVRLYSVERSQKLKIVLKSRLRTVYTKLYSAWLFQSGQMRRKIDFA